MEKNKNFLNKLKEVKKVFQTHKCHKVLHVRDIAKHLEDKRLFRLLPNLAFKASFPSCEVLRFEEQDLNHSQAIMYFLETWVSHQGRNATIKSIRKILKTENLTDVQEKLKNFGNDTIVVVGDTFCSDCNSILKPTTPPSKTPVEVTPFKYDDSTVSELSNNICQMEIEEKIELSPETTVILHNVPEWGKDSDIAKDIFRQHQFYKVGVHKVGRIGKAKHKLGNPFLRKKNQCPNLASDSAVHPRPLSIVLKSTQKNSKIGLLTQCVCDMLSQSSWLAANNVKVQKYFRKSSFSLGEGARKYGNHNPIIQETAKPGNSSINNRINQFRINQPSEKDATVFKNNNAVNPANGPSHSYNEVYVVKQKYTETAKVHYVQQPEIRVRSQPSVVTTDRSLQGQYNDYGESALRKLPALEGQQTFGHTQIPAQNPIFHQMMLNADKDNSWRTSGTRTHCNRILFNSIPPTSEPWASFSGKY